MGKSKKIALFLICFPFILNILGCWFVVGSAAGVAGAYVAGKDTVQAETDKPYDNLWNAALSVGKVKGVIKTQDYGRGYIELEAEKSLVWIRLVRLTQATIRLRISARKYRLPNLILAQDIYIKIMEQAR